MEWWVWGLGLIVAGVAAIYFVGRKRSPQYPPDLMAPRPRQAGKLDSRPTPTVETRPASRPTPKRSGGPKPDLAEILGYHPDYHFEQETLAICITVKNRIIDP